MKVQGPLHSFSASGTLADVLTFSKRKSGQQARFQRKQKDAESSGQLSQREKFSDASLLCRSLDFGDVLFGLSIFGNNIAFYDALVANKDLSGYNLCVSENIV